MNENMIELYNVNKEKFQMEGIRFEDNENVTIVTPGYIITPDGDFIIVDSKRHHRDVFDDYLFKYFAKDHEPSDTITAIKKLNKIKHIVYCGVRTGAINSGYFSSNQGVGYIFMPELEDVSQKQKEAIETLLSTNVSAISKRQILDIMFANTINDKEYTEEEFKTEIALLKNK